MKELVELINVLPEVLIYFVPGAIFLYLHYFICSKEQNRGSDNYFIFKSLLISFVLVQSIQIIASFVSKYSSILLNSAQYKILIIVVSLIASYILSLIYVSNWFKIKLTQIGINRSVHANIWNEIVDKELGMYAKVYIPSEKIIYYGALIRYEEKDDNYFLIISQYESYTYDDNDIDNFSGKKEYWVAINIKNISRIELVYNPKSKIINGQDLT